MIDIHSHILPMIDDGAGSVEEALDMLVMAYEDGSDAVFLTPHYATPYEFNNPKDKIIELFEDLKRIVKYERIPIEIYLGCEYLFSSIECYFSQKENIMTLNHTKYLLMEFFFDVTLEEITEAIECVKKDGFIPILAHPERYEIIQMNPDFAIQLSKENTYLQLNKASICGKYGENVKECAHALLFEKAYTYVGSDAHHTNMRTSCMNKAYELVKKYYGTTYAKELFYKNAQHLLGGLNNEREY